MNGQKKQRRALKSFGPEDIGVYLTNIASNVTRFNHLFSHFLFGRHFYVSQSFCDAVISAVSPDSPALKYTHTQTPTTSVE